MSLTPALERLRLEKTLRSGKWGANAAPAPSDAPGPVPVTFSLQQVQNAAPAPGTFQMDAATKQRLNDLYDSTNAESATAAKGLADLEPQMNGLRYATGLLESNYKAPDPFARDKAQNAYNLAATTAEETALKLAKPQDRTFTPLEAPGAYPQEGTVPIPQRPDAKVNPAASILAGIGGLIAPQGASHFAGSAIEGAVQRANQVYGDALRTRQMQIDQLDQQHKDEVAARNETLRLAEDNMERKDRIDVANLLAKHEYDAALRKVGGEKAGSEAYQTEIGQQSIKAMASSQMAQKIEAMKENYKLMQEKQKLLIDQTDRIRTAKVGLAEATARIEQAGQTAAALDTSRKMMAANAQANTVAHAAGQGYDINLGKNGTPPTVTPRATGNLSEGQKLENQRKNAEIGNLKSLAAYHMQQIENIKNGKAADLTKATPAQRLALQQLQQTKTTYDHSVNVRAQYMAKNGPITVLGTDPTYIALTKQLDEAANQYHIAHKSAVEAVGGTYGGTIPGVTQAPSKGKLNTYSPADAAKLPKGTHFLGADGKEYIRP